MISPSPPRALTITASHVSIAGLGLAASLVVGCESVEDFQCRRDSDCRVGAMDGTCELNGYCSFDDPTCASNRRYGDHAPLGIANVCVSEAAATGTGGSDAGSGASPSASGTTAGAGTGSDSAPVEPDSSGSGGSTDPTESGGPGTEGPPDDCMPFIDDFEDGRLDAMWSLDPGSPVREEQGQLRLDVTTPAGFVSVQLAEAFDLSDDRVRVELGTTPGAAQTQQFLILRDFNDVDGTTSATMFIENGVLRARLTPSEGDFVDVGEVEFDPQLHRWLQIRGRSDTMYFEVAAEDLEFETLAGVGEPFPMEAIRVELVAGNWQDIAEPETLSFEHFEICAEP